MSVRYVGVAVSVNGEVRRVVEHDEPAEIDLGDGLRVVSMNATLDDGREVAVCFRAGPSYVLTEVAP